MSSRAFSITGLQAWNWLPTTFWNTACAATFKKHSKTIFSRRLTTSYYFQSIPIQCAVHFIVSRAIEIFRLTDWFREVCNRQNKCWVIRLLFSKFLCNMIHKKHFTFTFTFGLPLFLLSNFVITLHVPWKVETLNMTSDSHLCITTYFSFMSHFLSNAK